MKLRYIVRAVALDQEFRAPRGAAPLKRALPAMAA